MAAFDFPSSPSTNQTHIQNGVQWKWNGSVWKRIETTGPSGAKGQKGQTGADNSTKGQKGADNSTKGQKGEIGVAGLDISVSPPAGPSSHGDMWWDSDDGDLHVYYNDGNSSQWVTVSQGPAGPPGGTAPFVSDWQIPL